MKFEEFATIVVDSSKNDIEVVDSMFKIENPKGIAQKIWDLFNVYRPMISKAFQHIALERFVEDLERYLDELDRTRREVEGRGDDQISSQRSVNVR
jgi:hypothetical protein